MADPITSISVPSATDKTSLQTWLNGTKEAHLGTLSKALDSNNDITQDEFIQAMSKDTSDTEKAKSTGLFNTIASKFGATIESKELNGFKEVLVDAYSPLVVSVPDSPKQLQDAYAYSRVPALVTMGAALNDKVLSKDEFIAGVNTGDAAAAEQLYKSFIKAYGLDGTLTAGEYIGFWDMTTRSQPGSWVPVETRALVIGDPKDPNNTIGRSEVKRRTGPIGLYMQGTKNDYDKVPLVQAKITYDFSKCPVDVATLRDLIMSVDLYPYAIRATTKGEKLGNDKFLSIFDLPKWPKDGANVIKMQVVKNTKNQVQIVWNSQDGTTNLNDNDTIKNGGYNAVRSAGKWDVRLEKGKIKIDYEALFAPSGALSLSGEAGTVSALDGFTNDMTKQATNDLVDDLLKFANVYVPLQNALKERGMPSTSSDIKKLLVEGKFKYDKFAELDTNKKYLEAFLQTLPPVPGK